MAAASRPTRGWNPDRPCAFRLSGPEATGVRAATRRGSRERESRGRRTAWPILPGRRAARNCTGRSRGEEAGARRDAEFLRSILLYEDDDVFVFNKPAGLAVQGGSGLTRHLDAMLEALRDRKGQKPRLVHRLDRDTSGVLLSRGRGSPPRSSRRPSAPARRARSTGRWSRACPSRARAASRPGSPSRKARRRAHAGRPPRRRRGQPRHIALLGGREGRPDARLALDAAGDRPHAPASGPCSAYRPSNHRRPQVFRGEETGNCLAESRTSSIYMRGASLSRTRRGARSTSQRRCRRTCCRRGTCSASRPTAAHWKMMRRIRNERGRDEDRARQAA